MKLLIPKIIISLTSYPARIHSVPKTLETVFKQTLQPDEIVLWLGGDRFPNRLADLPYELQILVENEKVSIEWCEDVGPHTKYFYAFKKYSDALIITIDDDILYQKDLIENLCKSYQQFPNAVSALRCRLIGIDDNGEFMGFREWPIVSHGFMSSMQSMLSMQFFAEGVGGVLYPSNLFIGLDDLFNKEVIAKTCRSNDDLWLKAIEVIAGIPVVIANGYKGINPVDGTQDVGLWNTYNSKGGTDADWVKVQKEIDARYGNGFLMNGIMAPLVGENFFERKLLYKTVNNLITESRKNNKLSSEKRILSSKLKSLDNKRVIDWGRFRKFSISKYLKYKILSKITFGSMRKRFRDQYQEQKKLYRAIKKGKI